ncbi:MAG: glycosyltransferase family 9 protein [Sphingobacteriaceae bacterium]|nr:glycosyltransferase family 9 protein [Sphingobacteriaceae bacterium]
MHAKFPTAKISILVRKGNETLFNAHPFLNEVIVWDKSNNKYSNLFKICTAIRKKAFDCVINCHRFASSGFLTAFSGAKHKAGYKQTPFSYLFNTTIKHVIGNGRHEIERYNDLVYDFAAGNPFLPKLYPSDKDFFNIKNFIDNEFVCIFPASVWFTKQLPESKWIELVNNFSKTEKVYILGAKNDFAMGENIKNKCSQYPVINLCGQLSLLESAALMKSAKMNYVNDSAPLHLASALGAKVTAYFCSTVPEFGFGPLSDNAIIKEVKNLSCRPCGLHGHQTCPKGHFKCGIEMAV